MKKLVASTLMVLAFLLAMPARVASAQSAPNLGTQLQTCVNACMVQRHICIQGMAKDLDTVCKGIPVCANVTPQEKSTFHQVCDACAKSETTYCTGGAAPATPGGPKPPATTGVGPTTQALTPEVICKQRGGIWDKDIDAELEGKTVMVCFTLKGARDRLLSQEKRLRELETQVKTLKDANQPVPPGTKTEIAVRSEDVQRILESIKVVQGQLNEYELKVEGLVIGLRNLLAEQVKRLDGRIDQAAQAQSARDEGQDQKIQDAAAKNAGRGMLTGWSIGPYYGHQVYNLYDQNKLHAAGLEASIFPSISDSGRLRLALNFGAGYGGKYFDKDLNEIHGHFGIRYSWDVFSLTVGPGFNRRSTFSHDDVSATWIGVIAMPRVSILSTQGHGLYLYGLTGLGNTHYQHGIVDVTGNKFDMPIMFGLGYEFLPIP